MGKEKIGYLQQNGNETKNKKGIKKSQWTTVNNVLKENSQSKILNLAKIPFKNKTKNKHFEADKKGRQSQTGPHLRNSRECISDFKKKEAIPDRRSEMQKGMRNTDVNMQVKLNEH